MSFKEINDLNCEVTTALGGHNKKTGKANPTKVEGYYLGSKDTASKKSKNGLAKLHIIQTSKGNVGVWGKTDLDRKMAAAPLGAMLRITQNGTVPTQNGDMYKFKVEVDADNSIEVAAPNASNEEQNDNYNSSNTDEDGGSFEDEESPFDEAPAAVSRPPARPASAADAARQAKVQALLSGKK